MLSGNYNSQYDNQSRVVPSVNANTLVSAISTITGMAVGANNAKKLKDRKAKIEHEKLLKFKASEVTYNYKIGKEQILGDTELTLEEQYTQIEALRGKHLGQLEKSTKNGDDEYAYEGFKNIQLDSLKSMNRIEALNKRQVEKKVKQDFNDKMTFGVFKTPIEALDYATKAKIEGVSETEIIKGFENLGTNRALKFIQESKIDGVPTELLQFKSRDEVIDTFYPELKGVKGWRVNNGIIGAISSAHGWQVTQREKAQRKREIARGKELSFLTGRLERAVKNSNQNANIVDDTLWNSLTTIEGLSEGKDKVKVQDIKAMAQDNKEVLGYIEQAFNDGSSRDDIEHKVSAYTTKSNVAKSSLLNAGISKVLNTVESKIDKVYNANATIEQKKQALGELYTKLYRFDSDEGDKKARADIKKELSTLSTSTLDNTVMKLETYISSRTNAGLEMPLQEQKLLNELQSVKALKHGNTEEISNYLNAKKRTYAETKRQKNKAFLANRVKQLKEELTEGYLENDNFATNRDINRFLIHNPDIPPDRIKERFIRETVDIDTTNSIFKSVFDSGWGGKRSISLSDQLQNGKIYIPDDRELRESSISGELKSYIGTHADKFVEYAIDGVSKHLDEIQEDLGGEADRIENLSIEFEKNSDGTLQTHVFGEFEQVGTKELLGIITHEQLTKMLNEVD